MSYSIVTAVHDHAWSAPYVRARLFLRNSAQYLCYTRRLFKACAPLSSALNVGYHAALYLKSSYRKVFERKCPEFIDRVERLNDLAPIKQGSTIHNISDEMLNLLTEAYRAAVLA